MQRQSLMLAHWANTRDNVQVVLVSTMWGLMFGLAISCHGLMTSNTKF